MAGERRRDYMVSKRVHFLYMLTWINSLLLVAAFGGLVYCLLQAPDEVRRVEPLFGLINPFLLLGVLAFVIVLTSLSLGVYTILHTHRLMGSAYRIGVVLRDINEGKPTRVHLRDGDFFMDIADEINRMADTFQGVKPAAATPETRTPENTPTGGAPATPGASS